MANGNGNGGWLKAGTWIASIAITALLTYFSVAASYGSRLSVMESQVDTHVQQTEKHETDVQKRARIRSEVNPQIKLLSNEIKGLVKVIEDLRLDITRLEKKMERVEYGG